MYLPQNTYYCGGVHVSTVVVFMCPQSLWYSSLQEVQLHSTPLECDLDLVIEF